MLIHTWSCHMNTHRKRSASLLLVAWMVIQPVSTSADDRVQALRLPWQHGGRFPAAGC